MKVKIVSDGTIQGTRVMSEKGELLEGVKYVSFQADIDGDNTEVILILRDVPVTLVSEAEVIKA